MKNSQYRQLGTTEPYQWAYGNAPKFNLKEWAAQRAARGQPITTSFKTKIYKRYALSQLSKNDAAGA